MKLTSSARTLSAAMIRSPSFSRSSSSSITTMRPAAISSSSSGMVAKAMSLLPGCEQSLDVARRHVDFEIHAIADSAIAERGLLERVRDQVHAEAHTFHRVDRQADAIHAHRTLGRDVAGECRWCLDDPALRTRVGLVGNDAA